MPLSYLILVLFVLRLPLWFGLRLRLLLPLLYLRLRLLLSLLHLRLRLLLRTYLPRLAGFLRTNMSGLTRLLRTYMPRLAGFLRTNMPRLVMPFMISKTVLISYFISLNPLLPLMAIFLHPGMRLPFASVSYFSPSLILEPVFIVPMLFAVPGVPV